MTRIQSPSGYRTVVFVRNARQVFECPDREWRVRFDSWGRQGYGSPEPFPEDHCVFTRPAEYGAAPCDSSGAFVCAPEYLEQARAYIVRAMRSGDDDARWCARGLARFLRSHGVRFGRV